MIYWVVISVVALTADVFATVSIRVRIFYLTSNILVAIIVPTLLTSIIPLNIKTMIHYTDRMFLSSHFRFFRFQNGIVQ